MLSVDEAALLEHSLPAALAQGAAHVVVVDNASTDGTADLARRLGADVVVLGQRRSYAAAMNAGLASEAAHDADAVLLLNADCVVGDGFLAALAAPLSDPAVGSVAPRLVRSTGMTAAERLDVLDAAGMVVDRRRKNTLVAHGDPMASRAVAGPCFGGDGACVLYRREVLHACALGGEVFDEDMALWASDVDLAWRAQLLGWRCAYAPDAVAWHKRFYSPTTRAAIPEEHRRLQFRNRYLMMLKNETAGSLARDLPRIALYELLALGHVVLRERHLLRGYRDALGHARGALERRRVVQARRARGGRVPFALTPPRAAASSARPGAPRRRPTWRGRRPST
jgi:GT2 family glycosyltransferase